MISSVFQFTGGRELVNEEKAEQLLASVSVTDPVHIRLSNKSFDNGAALKISEYLNSLSAIEIADISDIIAGRPEDEALRTLTTICSGLKKFDLKEINVSDNAFGGKGVEACRDILIKKNIEKLYMCNNGLSAEACGLVAKILLEDGCPPLRVLHFYNNMSGSGGATAVSDVVRACLDLQDFRFSATRSGPEGCLAIAQAISSISKLRRIDLSDNNVGAEASAVLADALKLQLDLEHLNLRDCGLSADGVEVVLDALKDGEFSALQHLDLSGNEIDEDLAARLAEVLVTLPSLTHLAIDDNELTSEGAQLIADAVRKLPALRTLSCCSCEITSLGGYSLASAVAKLPEFVNLELNGNQLVERAVEEMRTLLTRHEKVLGDLDDNDEDAEDDLEEHHLVSDKDEHQSGADEDALVKALEAATL